MSASPVRRRGRLALALVLLLPVLGAGAGVGAGAWAFRRLDALDAELADRARRIERLERENARLTALLVPRPQVPSDRAALALVLEADLEAGLLALINADRGALGRPVLVQDPQLEWVADWRARDMAARQYYGHTSPLGETAATVLGGFGGPNVIVGENIWSCASWQACDSALIHATFKASPGHKDNQELERYDHFGLGVALDLEGRLLVAELFSDQSAVRALAARAVP